MATPTDTSGQQPSTSFIIEPMGEKKDSAVNGYFVTSTAPINVEELPAQGADPSAGIEALAQRLSQAENPEITISIHGYGTRHKDAKVRYRKILSYANTLYEGQNVRGNVFMGYLWPSEPVNDSIASAFRGALKSLPTLLILLLGGSLAILLGNFSFLLFHSFLASLAVFLVVFLVLQVLADTRDIVLPDPLSSIRLLGIGISIYGLILLGLDSSFVLRIGGWSISLKIGVWAIASSVTAVILGVILALLLLRLANYLRDSYRASNYAVTDLVDLAQLLDEALAKQDLNGPKIQLNFIAHSMGCFVTTNVIRVVSDAFQTSSEDFHLGKRLALGRLILVAPDISIQTIMPGRSNLFSYALKRFQETYVFSNEGDLALRLASTAVNYIRFPAKTRFMGYRLGCITVKHFDDRSDKKNKPNVSDYGIVNLPDPHQPTLESLSLPHHNLSIRASNQEHRSLVELEPEALNESQFILGSVVNTFTYFDCTDYKDFRITCEQPSSDNGTVVSQSDVKLVESDSTVGIVSNASKKKALGLREYARLAWDYFVPPKIGGIPTGSRSINTHGGFFNGSLTFKLITGLAFVGFQKCCQDLGPTANSSAIAKLHDACEQKDIQVVISPKRL